MKKIIAMMVMAIISLSAMAEDLYVGGTLNFWRDASAKQTTFSIVPEIGYRLNQKWDLGLSIGYSHEELGEDDDKVISNTFEIAPYARYTYFKVGIVDLFVDGGFGIETGKARYHGESSDAATAWNIGFKPGIAVNVNSKFTILAHFGFLGYEGANDAAEDLLKRHEGFGLRFTGENLNFGLRYNF